MYTYSGLLNVLILPLSSLLPFLLANLETRLNQMQYSNIKHWLFLVDIPLEYRHSHFAFNTVLACLYLTSPFTPNSPLHLEKFDMT